MSLNVFTHLIASLDLSPTSADPAAIVLFAWLSGSAVDTSPPATLQGVIDRFDATWGRENVFVRPSRELLAREFNRQASKQ